MSAMDEPVKLRKCVSCNKVRSVAMFGWTPNGHAARSCVGCTPGFTASESRRTSHVPQADPRPVDVAEYRRRCEQDERVTAEAFDRLAASTAEVLGR